MIGLIESIGSAVIQAVEEVGATARIGLLGLLRAARPPWRVAETFHQMAFVGVQSLTIIVITGIFTGAVFALQADYAFGLFGANSLTGSTVTLSLTRELGPVLAALMVTGRAGSAMAAELGTMRITEQIDALESMAVDPVEYLVTPRILAGITMVPALAAVFSAVGMAGCWFVSIHLLDIPQGPFIDRIQWYVDPDDLTLGLAKAAVFGFIVAAVGCAQGLGTRGGARGVGQATTRAVVVASVLVLVVDYFLTDWWMT